GWGNFILDPRADLQAQFEYPRPTDATGYNNEEVNELFAQARVTLDRDEEIEIYHQIQEITEGEAVYVYLWRNHDLLVVNQQFSLPTASVAGELYDRAAEWSARS